MRKGGGGGEADMTNGTGSGQFGKRHYPPPRNIDKCFRGGRIAVSDLFRANARVFQDRSASVETDESTCLSVRRCRRPESGVCLQSVCLESLSRKSLLRSRCGLCLGLASREWPRPSLVY